MGEHANVALVRKGYAAFDTGDFETIRDLFDDNIVWHVQGNSSFSGDYKGKDEVFGFFSEVVQFTSGTLKNQIHDVLANDEHATALVNFSATRDDGKSLNQNEVHVFHLSNGKVTEWWSYGEDLAAADAFFTK